MSNDLKTKIQDAMKTALRAQEKERLGTIRLIQAAIKQKEVDERIVLTEEQILTILDKMVRQRREAIKQFEAGNRPDLVQKESAEIQVIQEFLPAPLTESEVQQLIQKAIHSSAAASVQDLSKVLSLLKPEVQGRADMSEVSKLVKQLLSEQ